MMWIHESKDNNHSQVWNDSGSWFNSFEFKAVSINLPFSVSNPWVNHACECNQSFKVETDIETPFYSAETCASLRQECEQLTDLILSSCSKKHTTFETTITRHSSQFVLATREVTLGIPPDIKQGIVTITTPREIHDPIKRKQPVEFMPGTDQSSLTLHDREFKANTIAYKSCIDLIQPTISFRPLEKGGHYFNYCGVCSTKNDDYSPWLTNFRSTHIDGRINSFKKACFDRRFNKDFSMNRATYWADVIQSKIRFSFRGQRESFLVIRCRHYREKIMDRWNTLRSFIVYVSRWIFTYSHYQNI